MNVKCSKKLLRLRPLLGSSFGSCSGSCARFTGRRGSAAFVAPALTHSRSLSKPPWTTPRSLSPSTAFLNATPGLASQRLRDTRVLSSSSIPRNRSSSDFDPLPIMSKAKWDAKTVRETFLNYFAERGHTIVPSSRYLLDKSQDPLDSGLTETSAVSCHTMTRLSCSPMLE